MSSVNSKLSIGPVLSQFDQRYSKDKFRGALDDAGSFGLASMQADTPVLTGTLRDSEYYQVNGDYELELGATAEYGPFVNGGTSRQRPNPFFDRGVMTTNQRLQDNLKAL